MTKANARVYTEAEIEAEFGEAYNQIKDEDDSREYDVPFRYITQWYLKESKDADDVRLALPDSANAKFNQGNKHHVICGLLESRDGNAPLSFELRQPVYWCVDRKKSKRGIWVPSSTDIWYWLKQPDAKQEAVNLPLRAKLGLLSNILDVFMEERDDMPYHYASAHLQMSPEAVHECLSCSDDSVHAQCNDPSLPVYNTPWDMNLFRNALPFLKRELSASVCTGWDKSKFWKALLKMKSAKTKWTPAEYLASAELAERRSQQQPWGEPLANPKPVRLNWIVDYVPERPSKKQRTSLEEDEDYVPERPSKQQRTGLEEDEAMTPAEKAKYTPKRIVQALKRLSLFLTPLPSSDESGKWEDVEHKFAVGDVSKKIASSDEKTAADVKKASLLVALMRSDEQFSEECKLLTVLAFKNACSNGKSKVAKKLFNTKGKAGVNILEEWRQDAINTLKQLAPPRHKSTGDWYSEVCVYKLVNAHIAFVRSCSFIKSKENLDMLKEKLCLDWNQGTYFDDVEQFGRKYSIRALLMECVRTKSHLAMMMLDERNVEEQEPPVAAVPAAYENDATAREDVASKQVEVQAGNDEDKGRQKRMQKMLAVPDMTQGVAMADPQPGQQSAGQRPTAMSALVSPSQPSSVASAPANLPTQEINSKFLKWTKAKPAYLLPWKPKEVEIEEMVQNVDYRRPLGQRPPFEQNREQQSGQEEGQPTAGVSGGPFGRKLVPDNQFSRRDHRPTSSSDRESEMGHRPAAINDKRSESSGRRHQINDGRYQHSDRQSRVNERAPERIDSRSRDNGRGSNQRIDPSLQYNWGSERSESRPSRRQEHPTDRSREYDGRSQHRSWDYNSGSEHIQSRPRHSSEDFPPRRNSQFDDRLDRRPASDSMHSTNGRGRGLHMTKPAWKTRLE